MAKEIVLFNDADFKAIAPTEAALDCYKLAAGFAGVEMDEETEIEFIQKRNLKRGWRDLWELKATFEKAAESIKVAVKHAFNIGTADELPNEGFKVSWSKQSFTYKFAEGAAAAVAETLIDKGLVTPQQLYNTLSVTAVAKAAGITTEKLIDMMPDTIIAEPIERTLSFK